MTDDELEEIHNSVRHMREMLREGIEQEETMFDETVKFAIFANGGGAAACLAVLGTLLDRPWLALAGLLPLASFLTGLLTALQIMEMQRKAGVEKWMRSLREMRTIMKWLTVLEQTGKLPEDAPRSSRDSFLAQFEKMRSAAEHYDPTMSRRRHLALNAFKAGSVGGVVLLTAAILAHIVGQIE